MHRPGFQIIPPRRKAGLGLCGGDWGGSRGVGRLCGLRVVAGRSRPCTCSSPRLDAPLLPPPQPRNPAAAQRERREDGDTQNEKRCLSRPWCHRPVMWIVPQNKGSLRPPVPSHTEPPRTGDGARGRIPRRHRNPRVNRGTPFQVELPELSNAALPAVRAPAMCHQRGGDAQNSSAWGNVRVARHWRPRRRNAK